ncbi:SDR family NAD(P)-dependent oxidoreductase [Rhodococcus sp. SJ-3]|uniref:SDR family NAD(P)-dependent oxidoreductase n=1 Tax=Rhodococcus sp. SJ-3 TaxID=3454628 RepID=UPI003F7AC925
MRRKPRYAADSGRSRKQSCVGSPWTDQWRRAPGYRSCRRGDPRAASKAAIVQLSEGLALYLRPKGIGVTLLCPGPVRTNIAASLPPGFGPATGTRGPGTQFGFLEPEVVGEQVADAIVDGTFWLPTDPQVRDVLVQRASDWDAFIDAQVKAIASAD